MPDADTFTYIGIEPQLGYYAYRDADTGTMLIAEAGGTYRIRAAEEGLPIPPADSRWTAAQPSSSRSKAPPAPVTVPASAEGGEN